MEETENIRNSHTTIINIQLTGSREEQIAVLNQLKHQIQEQGYPLSGLVLWMFGNKILKCVSDKKSNELRFVAEDLFFTLSWISTNGDSGFNSSLWETSFVIKALKKSGYLTFLDTFNVTDLLFSGLVITTMEFFLILWIKPF